MFNVHKQSKIPACFIKYKDLKVPSVNTLEYILILWAIVFSKKQIWNKVKHKKLLPVFP